MTDAGALARIGGDVALDFANTAGWHAREERVEHLTSYDEWLAWLRHGGRDLERAASRASRTARAHPARAAKALRQVVAMREVVYRIFAAIAQDRAPTAPDLAVLHEARLAALAAASPSWRDGRLALTWNEDDEGDLLAPLRPLVLAASDLLESPRLERVRQCGNHPCGWLFLDQSKNGSRRWCSSAECGNATRVRNFRARQSSGD